MIEKILSMMASASKIATVKDANATYTLGEDNKVYRYRSDQFPHGDRRLVDPRQCAEAARSNAENATNDRYRAENLFLAEAMEFVLAVEKWLEAKPTVPKPLTFPGDETAGLIAMLGSGYPMHFDLNNCHHMPTKRTATRADGVECLEYLCEHGKSVWVGNDGRVTYPE